MSIPRHHKAGTSGEYQKQAIARATKWVPKFGLVVSLQLFQILTVEGYFAHVICAISLQNWDITGFGFVDDMDLCTMAASHKVADVFQQMQLSLKLWTRLLLATREALVPENAFGT